MVKKRGSFWGSYPDQIRQLSMVLALAIDSHLILFCPLNPAFTPKLQRFTPKEFQLGESSWKKHAFKPNTEVQKLTTEEHMRSFLLSLNAKSWIGSFALLFGIFGFNHRALGQG